MSLLNGEWIVKYLEVNASLVTVVSLVTLIFDEIERPYSEFVVREVMQ
jgi:hypothetical protein